MVKKEAPTEIEAEPGFFGRTIKPGKALAWSNEVEEFALQLTSAALGPKVINGRSTLFVEVKDTKVALCTLVPEKAEQCSLQHLFTPFDGPVVFHNEGVNEIHLTGMIDVQDGEGDDDDDHHGHDHSHDHGHHHDDDGDSLDYEGMPGTYSDSDSDDDSDVMVFGADDDDDETEDEAEDGGRFEVVEERLHGDLGEKKQAEKKQAEEKKVKQEPKQEATPSKKEATPSKKDAKKEAAKSPATEKADASKSKDANNKKRPAPTEEADASKKAKTTTRVYKGVTIEETAPGKGQPIAKGKKVKILYKGRLTNGKQFDANQNRKSPFEFRHGAGDVIKGMDIGIEGMRPGGKRTITIPAHLGYGKSGSPPVIPGNATLIFEIELL